MGEYRTVYKYPLASPVMEIGVPVGGIIRLVGTDPASRMPTLWIEHALPDSVEKRTFLVLGTGQMVEPGAVHVGSMIAGPFVWHVYERPTPATSA